MSGAISLWSLEVNITGNETVEMTLRRLAVPQVQEAPRTAASTDVANAESQCVAQSAAGPSLLRSAHLNALTEPNVSTDT